MQIELQFGDQHLQATLKSSQSIGEFLREFALKGKEAVVACAINGKMVDQTTRLSQGDLLELYTFEMPKGQEVFWHTSAHILAQAVLRLFPDAKPTIGPPIEQGFYYDFADLHLSDTDFERIEEEVEKIVKENYLSERVDFTSAQEALHAFASNKYKVELIEGFSKEGGKLSGYRQGEFFDLCRGPHLRGTGQVRAFKVMKTSGAYWRADSNKEMLTRIYGISFPDRKQLKEYLFKLEEAKKRDHKILGPKLDLFSLKEEAPGIPFIHPKGMILWNRLLDYWRECHKRCGYVEIKTPSLMIRDLWERSGHWQNYKENMFTSTIEEREFAIKPMNCPGAMLYYLSKSHSYRELPLKVAEIGQVHRYEPSGALSGLFRVRAFHQDDAHIFCSLDNVQPAIHEILSLVDEMYTTFGLKYALFLSTRPDSNTIGTDEEWALATNGLKQALQAHNMPYTINEGDGAFYGPKIDIKVYDALGRMWQCSTIQLDMALPERFELEYMDADGEKKRPVIIHRVIFGSIERFIGSLIEFYAGKFPLWLNPNQVALVPVADRHTPYAEGVAKLFSDEKFEVHVDGQQESVSKKIRNAQLNQYNYILTVGDKEVESGTVSVRTRDNVVHGDMPIEQLLEVLKRERHERARDSKLHASQGE